MAATTPPSRLMVAVDDESEAAIGAGVIAEPDASDWSPGLVTDTVLVMVQVNDAVAWKPALSVAVMVTE